MGPNAGQMSQTLTESNVAETFFTPRPTKSTPLAAPSTTVQYQPVTSQPQVVPAQSQMDVQSNVTNVNITQQQVHLNFCGPDSINKFKNHILGYESSYSTTQRNRLIKADLLKAIDGNVQAKVAVQQLPENYKDWQNLPHQDFFDLLQKLYPSKSKVKDDTKLLMSASQKLLAHKFQVAEVNFDKITEWFQNWYQLADEYRRECIQETPEKREELLWTVAKRHMES